MKRGILIVFTAALALAAAGDGIRPRGSSGEYPAHVSTTGAAVGAAVIAPDHVRKLFATDLNHAGYVVVELAIYPEAGTEINVSQNDFMLRVGQEGNAVRAASGETIAAVIADVKKPKDPPQIGGHDVTVYPTATIGYESGTDPYNGRRVGGVYGGAGVGVGVGNQGGPPPPPPGVAVRDQATMQRELEDKALPEGKTREAVAGYLYFPRPSKKKGEPLSLTWYAPNGNNVRLTLPAAK